MVRKTYRSSDAAFRESIRDISLAVENWRLPIILAWRELQNRYRRSLLGPLWLTLTLAIRIGALGLIFSNLFDQPVGFYLVWLTSGIVAWEFVSGTLQSSCEWFSSRSGYIKQGQATLGSLVIWGMVSQVLMLLHALPLSLAVSFCFGAEFNANLLFLPLGILMLCAVLMPVGVILAMLVPRLRDVEPLISSLLQVAFFVIPIMWLPQDRGIIEVVTKWNPFSYLISWIRNPLLGEGLKAVDFIIFFALLLVLVPLALLIFVKFRKRIAYWL